MKIAIPTNGGILSPHFGQCQAFAIIEVDTDKKTIIKTEMMTPPPHEPGILPRWLGDMGCNLVIAGGMGGRAINMFDSYGIGVVTGAPTKKPDDIVLEYLQGELITSGNYCDGQHAHSKGQGCGQREQME